MRCEIAALGVRTGSSTAPEQGFRILHRTVGIFLQRGHLSLVSETIYRTSCSRTRRLPPSSLAILEPAFQAKLNHGYILWLSALTACFSNHIIVFLSISNHFAWLPLLLKKKKKKERHRQLCPVSLDHYRIVPKSSSHPVSKNHGEDDDEADLFPLLLLPEEAGPEISWTGTTPNTFILFLFLSCLSSIVDVGDEDKIGRTPEIVRTTVSLFSVGAGRILLADF